MTAYGTPEPISRKRKHESINHGSPFRGGKDTPTKQLLWELALHDQELSRQFQAKLDASELEQEKQDNLALAKAALERERIRQSADRVNQLLLLEIEKEYQQRELEERAAIDKERRERAEREVEARRRELQATYELEEKERQAAAARAEQEEVKRKAEQRRQQEAEAEAARKAAEETQRADLEAQRLRHEAEAKQKAQEAAQNVAPVLENPNQQTVRSVAENEHSQYLAIHQRLKDMRKYLKKLSADKSNPGAKQLKEKMGDGRRRLQQSVGQLQLTGEKGANNVPRDNIKNVLMAASQSQQPLIDIRPFLRGPLPSSANDGNSQVPALLIYLINIFAKGIVRQLMDEAGVAPQAADPIGLIAINIFATPAHRWQGTSLIDILLAKYHKSCPALFGIFGSENTEQGLDRIGWVRDDSGKRISEQRHGERMTGLGAGFASLSLRNFQRSAVPNPLPPDNYWKAFSYLVNVAPQDSTKTQFFLLKAMIEHHAQAFISFYGQFAIVALRKAIVELPHQAPPSTASKALSTLKSTLQRDINLLL